MKISLKLAVAVLAASILVFGCKTSADPDTSIHAPDVGTVNNVDVPEGATTTFTASDGTAALALYTSASNLLDSAVEAKANASSTSVSNAREAANGQPVTTSYDFTVTPAAGGTIVCTGSKIQTLTSKEDSITTVTANTRYSGIMTFAISGNVNETITGATVTDGAHTYTINGIAKNTVSMNCGFDLLTGSDLQNKTDWKFYLNFGFGLGAGSALSVVREDGLYAKFLITYEANYGKSNIACDDVDDSLFSDNLISYLSAQTARLSVYDKDNNLILTKELPMSNAFSTSIFGSM